MATDKTPQEELARVLKESRDLHKDTARILDQVLGPGSSAANRHHGKAAEAEDLRRRLG